jgi:hypothetical protein
VKFIINSEYDIISYLESLMNIAPKYTVKLIELVWKSVISDDTQKCIMYYMNRIFVRELELFGSTLIQQNNITKQPILMGQPQSTMLTSVPTGRFNGPKSTCLEQQTNIFGSANQTQSIFTSPATNYTLVPMTNSNTNIATNNISTFSITCDPKIKKWAEIIKEDFMCNMSHPNFAASNSPKKRTAIHNFLKSSLYEPTMTMQEALQVAAMLC